MFFRLIMNFRAIIELLSVILVGTEMEDIYHNLQVRAPWDSNVQLMTGFFLRISFDVVPNNGSPRTKIVKSFKIKANPIDIKS